jgi:hypothetical protein
VETPLGHDIDAAAEQALDTLAEVHEGEASVARLVVHEEIDVAARSCLASSQRAEDPDSPNAVARTQRADLLGQILGQ